MPIGYQAKPTTLIDRAYRWLATRLSRYAGGLDEVPPPEKMGGFSSGTAIGL